MTGNGTSGRHEIPLEMGLPILLAMADQPQNGPPGDTSHVMTLYGRMMTRTGGIFALGMVAIVPFGLISLAVTTRYLDPADFGRLSILFAVSSVLTIFCGVGFLQGTMILAYGIADDGDDGGASDVVEEDELDLRHPKARAEERKRILGSGLLIVMASSTVLCLVVGLIGGFVVGGDWTGSVHWMAASAWAGGIWRMAHQVPRMERRAVTWAILQWVRPALVVAGTVAALSAGLGIEGVLMATAAGTVGASIVSFAISMRCFRFAPKRDDYGRIWRRGKGWIPLSIAIAIQGNVSVLLLGVLASPTSVGLYQVANRIAGIPNYYSDGFIHAWPAMERSAISIAAKDRKGRAGYQATVFTLLALSSLGLLVAVSLLADLLIHIAAPEYESAAALIPVVAGSYGVAICLRGTFRATAFPKRRYCYTAIHLLWIAPYAAVSLLLIPWDPGFGVAIAQIVAGVLAVIAYVSLDRRFSSEPTPFQWKRLGFVAAIGILCVVVAQLAPPQSAAQAALSVVGLVAFPVLLLMTGAISRRDLEIARTVAASIIPRRVSKVDARRRLAELPGDEREALQLLVCDRVEAQRAAEEVGVSEPVILARVTRGLRHFAGEGRPTPVDHLIGEYVLHRGTTLDRDALAANLRSLGVDSLQIHVLDEANGRVARIGRT